MVSTTQMEVEISKSPEFEQYINLPPEIRAMIIKNLEPADQFNYGKCSKYCASEAFRIRTRAPESVMLTAWPKDFRVKLVYGDGAYIERRFVYADSCMQDVQKFMDQQNRFVRNGKTTNVYIDSVFWPTELMDRFRDVESLNVVIYQPMLAHFLAYANYGSHQTLVLKDCKPTKLRATIPHQFFESPLFTNLVTPILQVNCLINDDAFLASNFAKWHITTSSLGVEVIRDKVRLLGQMVISDKGFKSGIVISIPSDNDKIYDMTQLTGIESTHNGFHIGRVSGAILEDGKKLAILAHHGIAPLEQ